jgi:ammonia channel protein AmtB
MIIFIFIWSTLVYNVVASWTWNVSGWSAKLGAIDYAGGVRNSNFDVLFHPTNLLS